MLLADHVACFLVRSVGAAAHRLLLRRRRVVSPCREHQDLLDQARARTARGAGLGVLAHVVEREQALVLDGLADRALADAVAAAHLVGVGQRRGLVLALVAGIAEAGFAEHQAVADVDYRTAVAQQLEVPAAVHGIAVQAGADELVVLDHQLLVDAALRVGQHDLVAAVAAHEVAGREQVDARHLQLGRDVAAGVAADAEHRQVRGADLGLLEQRRDQAVGDAAVRGALAHGVDARVGDRLQGVADDDAALAQQPGRLGQRGVGADAGGHHHEVGRLLDAVLEADRLHAARRAVVATADQRIGLRADHEG